MGIYYSPKAVRQYGVRIHHALSNPTAPRFRNNLVAVCDRGLSDFAVDVSEEAEYQHFLEQYHSGLLMHMDLYDYDPQCVFKGGAG